MFKFLGLLLIPTLSFASVKVDLSQAPSGVEFLAVGKPSALKINGTGGKLAGTIEVDGTEIKGRILVKINDFSTGISLRDQHMKEKYLETEKFSDAWLEIKKIELPQDFLKSKKILSAIPFEGTLSLHGVEKPVKGVADVDSSGEMTKVSTEIKIQVSDFSIAIPSYLGIKVADEVTIKTHMDLKLAQK